MHWHQINGTKENRKWRAINDTKKMCTISGLHWILSLVRVFLFIFSTYTHSYLCVEATLWTKKHVCNAFAVLETQESAQREHKKELPSASALWLVTTLNIVKYIEFHIIHIWAGTNRKHKYNGNRVEKSVAYTAVKINCGKIGRETERTRVTHLVCVCIYLQCPINEQISKLFIETFKSTQTIRAHNYYVSVWSAQIQQCLGRAH